jgi:hypothetical protein
MDAAVSGMRGTGMAVLETLLQATASQSSPAETAITMIAAALLRSGSDANVQATLAHAGRGRGGAAGGRRLVLSCSRYFRQDVEDISSC